MNEEIKEQTSKEFTVQEWKHWSTKQSEFVRLPESCKSEITKWWLDKLDQALEQHNKRLVEEIVTSEAYKQITNHQRQLDEYGEFVGVSRQAIDELVNAINLISPPSEE